jgi:hypothetical protein
LLVLAGRAFALGPVLPDYLPADTKVVIGINLRHLIDSPLGKELSAHATALPIPAELPGLDFLHDVDEILIATNAAGQNAPALLVLKGRFQGPSVQTDPKHPGMTLAILDANSAIGGETALVQAAMERRGKGATFAAMEARIAPLVTHYDLWGAGRVDSGEEFSFGASLQEGLEVAGEVRFNSPAQMKQITEMLKPFEEMLKAQAGSASKVSIQTQGMTLKVSMKIPEEELKKAMEAQKDAIMGTLASQFQPKPKPPKTEGKILTDQKGNTLRVVLPGGGR